MPAVIQSRKGIEKHIDRHTSTDNIELGDGAPWGSSPDRKLSLAPGGQEALAQVSNKFPYYKLHCFKESSFPTGDLDYRQNCWRSWRLPMQPHHTVTFDHCPQHYGLPRWLTSKEFAWNARDAEDVGLISGWGRSLGGGNGNPVQYSCWDNPMEEKTVGQQSLGSQRVRHDWAQPSRSLLWVAEWGVGTTLLLASFTQVNMFQACMCTCVWICDPMDCTAPGSFVQGIFQARILKWIAVPYSRGSPRPRDRTCISRISWLGRWSLPQCHLGRQHR